MLFLARKSYDMDIISCESGARSQMPISENADSVSDGIKYFNNDISILSELYRLEQLQQILLDIKTIYAAKYTASIDTFKSKKISIFVSLWIMNQFNTINASEIIPDPVFPYNAYNNKQLEINLVNTGIVANAVDATRLVAEWDIGTRMTHACIATTKFIKSPEFQTAKNDYKVVPYEEYISSSRFIKIKITSSDSKRFKYAKPNKFFIPYALYHKLVAKYSEYIPSVEECATVIAKLLLRYYTLDSDNQQLAVLPEFYNALAAKYNIDMELFASGINVHCQRFCSLYYDIERSLGSMGYFHNYEVVDSPNSITDGKFLVANPPFDEDIMLGMVSKFIKWLKLAMPISIVLTIPQWGEYATFETFEKLVASGYIRHHWIIPKTHARFYHYMKDKIVFPCNVYLIILQNASGVARHPNLVSDLEHIKKIVYI